MVIPVSENTVNYNNYPKIQMGNICEKPQKQPTKISQLKQLSSTLSVNPRVEASQIFELLTLTSQNSISQVSQLQISSSGGPKYKKSILDFKPIRSISKNMLGQTFLVIDTCSKQYYAMKVIDKKLIKNAQLKSNVLDQRYLLEALDCNFIVKLHYAFQSKTKLYLLVDFMPGVTYLLSKGELFYLLRKERRFEESVAKFYAAEILLALEYLHNRNIIYRDLKPENILLTKQGHIKIADFGISKICFNKNQLAFSICGTPQYIAPEIIQGKGYDKSADWFSFGSLLYDMLTGRPPFYSKNKHEILMNIISKQVPIPKNISPAAQSLLKSLFEKKPANRLGSKNDAEEIRQHQFFNDIDFVKLQNQMIEPPIKFHKDINNQGFDRLSNCQKQISELDLSQEMMSGESGAFKNFQYFGPAKKQEDEYKSQQFNIQDLQTSNNQKEKEQGPLILNGLL